MEEKGEVAPAAAPWRSQAPLRWYLWDGGFLALGRSEGVVPSHAHHAFQIVIAWEAPFAIRGIQNEWLTARGIIVPPDVEHSFDPRGEMGAMLFVDPESSEGTWLKTVVGNAITLVPDARLAGCVEQLRAFCEQPFEAMEVGPLIRHCVQSLCPGAPPARRLDRRVTNVLKAIHESHELKMSLEDAAEIAALSPSRFAHLFKLQLGLPFRRYLLWRKMTRAMVAIARERTLGAAAQAGDFADAAHLTRTFYQMFGLPPSVMMRGDFFAIPSPFEVFAEQDSGGVSAGGPRTR